MMSDWKEMTLLEAGVHLFDCIHKTPPEVNDGLPYVAIPQIHTGRIDYASARKISQDHFDEWTQKIKPQLHDIVLSRRCNPGVTAYVDGTQPFALGQNLVLLRSCGSSLVPQYLRWLCRGREWWEQVASFLNVGSTFDSLKCADIPQFKFLIPPAAEQQVIADILSPLDDKIDLLHRQNKTLEAMAETLFRQWFVEEASDRVPITKYVDFNPTRRLSKGGLAPYLDMAGVSTTTFNPSGWYDREFSSGTKFTNGDTLLARITPCLENGKSAFVTFLKPGQVGWGSTEFIVMRSREPLSTFFTYALARNQEFRDYAEGCMAGSSGRQRVDVEHLKQFEIGSVSSPAVSEFNNLVEPIPPKLHANMLQISTLEKLRDTLLPKLMSGEVRVQYE